MQTDRSKLPVLLLGLIMLCTGCNANKGGVSKKATPPPTGNEASHQNARPSPKLSTSSTPSGATSLPTALTVAPVAHETARTLSASSLSHDDSDHDSAPPSPAPQRPGPQQGPAAATPPPYSAPTAVSEPTNCLQALERALYQGNEKQAIALLQQELALQPRDMSEKANQHRTRCLCVAAGNGFVDFLSAIAAHAEMGYALNERDTKLHCTPLLSALDAKQLAAARKLLELGADPAISGADGYTALHWAAARGKEDLAQVIIDKNKAMKDSLRGRKQIFTSPLTEEGQAGYTPLHLAASRGQHSMVHLLASAYPDPHNKAAYLRLPDQSGNTPLHCAVQADSQVTVAILLVHGARPSMKNHAQRCPADMTQEASLKTFLERGSSAVAIPASGHRSVVGPPRQAQEGDSVELLAPCSKQEVKDWAAEALSLQELQKVRDNEGYGYSLLHWAVLLGSKSAVRSVVKKNEVLAGSMEERKALFTARSTRGYTPLHLAARCANATMIHLLARKYPDAATKATYLHLQDEDGNTPLHIAAYLGDEATVATLVGHGAQNVENTSGSCPSDMTSKRALRTFLIKFAKPSP